MKHRQRLQIHNQHGLTLIEAIMIVIIIGIMSIISIPRLGSSDKQLAYTTARQIVADMRHVRNLAITSAKDHIVKFSPSGGPYSEYRIFSDEGETEVQVGSARRIPAQITCTGTEELTFYPIGSASSNGTISLVAGDSQYNVNFIAATGRAYEEEL